MKSLGIDFFRGLLSNIGIHDLHMPSLGKDIEHIDLILSLNLLLDINPLFDFDLFLYLFLFSFLVCLLFYLLFMYIPLYK